jgi:hypothetical protein
LERSRPAVVLCSKGETTWNFYQNMHSIELGGEANLNDIAANFNCANDTISFSCESICHRRNHTQEVFQAPVSDKRVFVDDFRASHFCLFAHSVLLLCIILLMGIPKVPSFVEVFRDERDLTESRRLCAHGCWCWRDDRKRSQTGSKMRNSIS